MTCSGKKQRKPALCALSQSQKKVSRKRMSYFALATIKKQQKPKQQQTLHGKWQKFIFSQLWKLESPRPRSEGFSFSSWLSGGHLPVLWCPLHLQIHRPHHFGPHPVTSVNLCYLLEVGSLLRSGVRASTYGYSSVHSRGNGQQFWILLGRQKVENYNMR